MAYQIKRQSEHGRRKLPSCDFPAKDAGERLLQSVGPQSAEVEAELAAVGEFAVKPKGTVRITSTEYAVDTAIWPRLAKVLPDYPELFVEVTIDYGLTDVVAERYELGVRNGDQIAKNMVAVRIGPDRRMVIVGAPSYFERASRPKRPDERSGAQLPRPALRERRPVRMGAEEGQARTAGARRGTGGVQRKLSDP